MGAVYLEIIIILILILLNGFFAMSEIALLSVKKRRLKQCVKQGNRKAQVALSLARQPSGMLSAIQIGITSIGIISGVFGGAIVAERLEESLTVYPLLLPYSEPISVFIVIIVITYVALIIGELVPKQIALANPEKISLKIAKPIQFFMKIGKPFVKLLSYSSNIVLKLLHIKPAPDNLVTKEDVRLLIAEGAETGIFGKSEQKMVENIFHLGSRPIKDYMTPKEEIIRLDVDDSVLKIKEKIFSSEITTFLIYKHKQDNIIGAVEIKDILTHSIDNSWSDLNLEEIAQPVVSLKSDLPSLVAIERLKNLSINIAIITDKNSEQIVGLISFHDILEAIVGRFKINR